VHIVYTLLVCIVPYSCLLTQLYNDLLGVKLVNPNENLLRILDTWQIFGTRTSYTGLSQCYFRQLRSDVMFQIRVCGIFRYLLFIVSS